MRLTAARRVIQDVAVNHISLQCYLHCGRPSPKILIPSRSAHDADKSPDLNESQELELQ